MNSNLLRSVDCLELTVRLADALALNEIKTIQDLIYFFNSGLVPFSNGMTRKLIREVEERLFSHGLI